MKIITLLILLTVFGSLHAQLTLSTDFTSTVHPKAPLHDIWTVANRISPMDGAGVRSGTDVNIVRMIGGIVKTVNGQKVPDLDYDPCRYDESTDTYVYNWTPLIARLNKIVNSNTKIHQLVLDQPPWAFQHGYTFIPKGTNDGIHFREDEKVTIYGNSLPPYNKEAYHDFIKAMIEKLIDTYGKEEVESWRFRVGSEIETPDHWRGTRQDFIEHFANTEKAVRAVLPNAKVGVHTRTPGFLYNNGTVKNYKGESFASFAKDLIEYCYDNGVQYDFWGISDYVLINGEKYRDISAKYNEYFKALVDHPKWNHNATLDVMEYSVVITMSAPDGGGYLTCASSHADIVDLGLSQMFYENGCDQIFRWGLRSGTDGGPIGELRKMVGDIRFSTEKSGTPVISSNQLNAIFTKNDTGNEFDAILFSYNVKSLNYSNDEPVKLSFAIDLPVGSKVYYRNNTYGIEQNKLQQFLKKEGTSWVKSGWDEKGAPDRSLTEEGYAKYQAFTNYEPCVFNEWKSTNSISRTDGGAGSLVVIETKIPSFAYKKFEFRLESQFVEQIAPSKVRWTSSEDFKPWKSITSGMSVSTTNDKLRLDFSEGFGYPMAEISGLNINADLFDQLRIVVRNTTEKDLIQMAANVPGTTFSTSRKLVTIPIDGVFHTIVEDISNWALWKGTITQFKFYNSVHSGSLEIDTLEFIPGLGAATLKVTITQEGSGLLNYRSGSCFPGQEFTLNAIAEQGWKFESWTGDLISTDNLLKITVTEDMTVKAIFKQDNTSTKEIFINSLDVYPNPSKNGIFYLNSSLKWMVYSLLGIKIAQGNDKYINLSGCKEGVYILKTNKESVKIVIGKGIFLN